MTDRRLIVAAAAAGDERAYCVVDDEMESLQYQQIHGARQKRSGCRQLIDNTDPRRCDRETCDATGQVAPYQRA